MIRGGEALEFRRLLAFDPTPVEQALLEHINRIRTEPESELAVYFKSTDPLRVRDAGGLANHPGLTEIQRAVDHFQVDGSLLAQQFAALTPVAPLAWNESLIDAAALHNGYMLSNNDQQHQFPGEPALADRLMTAGYNLSLALENVFAYAENQLYGHAGFIIDWGTGTGGIQTPPGHRDNIMNPQIQEVGISVLETVPADPDNDVGPMLITQDFGRRNNYSAQVLGVVWEDGFQDSSGVGMTGIYDPGEGYGGVNITAQGNGQIFTTSTMSAGGYQLALPPGTYTITAKGASPLSPVPAELAVGNVVIGNSNVKVDFQTRGAVNRRATAVADAISADAGQPTPIDVTSNDTDNDGTIDASTVAIWTQPEHGTVSVDANGVVTYTADAGYLGNDSFQYIVADNSGAFTAPATVNISVADVNSAPVAVDSALTTQVGVAAMHDISDDVTDSDGTVDWSSLEITQQPTSGAVQFDAGSQSFTYTPNAGFDGSDSFQYRVADDQGAFSNNATVSVTVNAMNTPPTAVDDTYAAIAGVAKTLDVTDNDTDPDSDLADGTVTITQSPGNGTATINGNQIEYTPDGEFRGVDTLQYQVSDGDGGTSANMATVTLYVVDPEAPWQNPVQALDVIPNNAVSPLDAILVINNLGLTDLNTGGPFPGLETAPPPFLDVNGNNQVDPLDAIQVINNLGLAFGAVHAPLSAAAQAPATSGAALAATDLHQLVVLPQRQLGADRDGDRGQSHTVRPHTGQPVDPRHETLRLLVARPELVDAAVVRRVATVSSRPGERDTLDRPSDAPFDGDVLDRALRQLF